jgi:hypothetical protein
LEAGATGSSGAVAHEQRSTKLIAVKRAKQNRIILFMFERKP